MLLASFTFINFFGIGWLSKVNSTLMWWKLVIPVLAIVVLLFKWHSGNWTAGGPGPIVNGAHINGSGGFAPFGAKGVLDAVVGAGIVFSYLGFEQADQLAGEIKNPQRNLPRAIIGAMLIGTAIYIMVQIVFIAAMDPSLLTTRLTGLLPGISDANVLSGPISSGPLRLAGIAARLAGDPPAGRRLRLPVRHRADLPDLDLPGHLRAVQEPVPAADLPADRQPGRALGQHDPRVRGRPAPSCCRSRPGRARRPDHRRERAHVRRRPARPSPRSATGCRTRPGRTGWPAAMVSPLAFIVASLLIYWSGFEALWKLGICIVIGYVIIGVCMAFDAERPRLGRKEVLAAALAAGVHHRHGHHLLARPVHRRSRSLAPLNTGRIPFWVDIPVVAAWALIIFVWAYFAALPRDEMELIIAEQAGVAADIAAVGTR